MEILWGKTDIGKKHFPDEKKKVKKYFLPSCLPESPLAKSNWDFFFEKENGKHKF